MHLINTVYKNKKDLASSTEKTPIQNNKNTNIELH